MTDRPKPPRRLRAGGFRAKVLGTYILLLALAIAGSLAVLRQVLVARLDERISANLQQEVGELRQLVSGRDPKTGDPFGTDVKRIFTVFLQRNLPSANEAMLTIVNGAPYRRSVRAPAYRIDQDEELVDLWRSTEDPLRGRADTPAGGFDYLALPVVLNDEKRGTFVVGIFRDSEKAEVDEAIQAAGLISLTSLLIGSLLASRLAEKVLGKVRTVSETASTISETDLHHRIDIEGDDEISRLAGTFNEMLDRIEDAFGRQRDFIDDAGHELRTPITIIRGHLELLGDDPIERTAVVALTLDELDRMARMVDDLLLLAKSEKPDFLAFETVSVENLTEELARKARGLGSRSWSVERMGKGIIEADRQRLTEAMMQLAENAVQHTNEGDHISIGSSMADGHAHFWVTDTGPGVPAEERTRIFERFARARSTARSSNGAGLGLAIVQAIAEGHHGRVELHTTEGRGSTFKLVLPADQPLPPEDVTVR